MKAKLVLDRAARRRLQKLDRKRRDADIRVRIRVIALLARIPASRHDANWVFGDPTN